MSLHHGDAARLQLPFQKGGGSLDLWAARGEHRVGCHGYLMLALCYAGGGQMGGGQMGG